jgi:hypothetical protein
VPIISGGSGGGTTVLFDQTLSGTALTIDSGASSIPASRSALLIVALLRSDEATNFSNGTMTFNNDATANYDQVNDQTVNATVTGATTLGLNGIPITCAGTTEVAAVFTSIHIFVPAYAQTTARKACNIAMGHTDSGGVANSFTRTLSGVWRSTSAITRVAFTAGGVNHYIAGSRVTIYGLT